MDLLLSIGGTVLWYLWIAVLGVTLLNIVVFVHELGHYLASKSVGVPVPIFSVWMGPPLFKFCKFHAWGTEWRLGRYPIGGLVKPLNAEYISGLSDAGYADLEANYPHYLDEKNWLEAKHPLQQLLIFAAGPGINVLFSIAVGTFLLWGRTDLPALGPPQIQGVVADSRAAESGVLKGDRLIAVNGQPMKSPRQAREELFFGLSDESLTVTVERGGKTLNLSSAPDKDKKSEIFGIEMKAVGTRPPPNGAEALQEATSDVRNGFHTQARFIWKLLQGKKSPKGISGPVGLVSAAGSAGSQGWRESLGFMVFLSTGLAFMNLLPIPILDGFHILLALAECVMGKRVNNNWRFGFACVGLSILLPLMLYTLGMDLWRLFT